MKYFSVLPYPNIAILDFGVFNIGIHCFGCSKHWTDCRFCWFFQTLEFYILAFTNIVIQCLWLYEHWNLVLLLLQTWILNFAFSIQCNSVFYLFQTFDFPLLVSFSRHWNSMFFFFQTLHRILDFGFFKKIEIQYSAFCKHWNTRILLFEKLHFSVFAYPNIGILDFGFFNIRTQYFGFSKHRNYEFLFFQSLEFWILAFSTLEFSVLVFLNTACL